MVNACGIVGAVLSAIGVILVAIGAAIPHFVDVYIIQFTSQIDDSDAVAGVGVFNSEYDGTVLSAEVLAESGVPNDKFSTPTLEFPLLFPAQENFVAQVLPINTELALELDAALGANGAISGPLITEIDVVTNLEFDSCDQYIPDALNALGALFTVLQTSTLPAVAAGLDASIVQSINDGMFGAVGIVTLTSPTVNPLRAVIAVALAEILAAFQVPTNPCFGVTGAAPYIQGVALCIAGGFEFAANQTDPATHPITNLILTTLENYAGGDAVTDCAAKTVQECFDDIETEVDFTPGATKITSFISFSAGTSSLTGCDLIDLAIQQDSSGTQSCNTVVALGEYIKILAGLIKESGDVLSAAGLSLFLNAITGFSDLIGINANTPLLVQNATDQITDFAFPNTFADNYKPCGYLALIQIAFQADLTTIDTGATTCAFEDYFQAAFEALTILENELAATMEEVATLYAACDAAVFGTSVAACPSIFALGLLDGAYGGDITSNPTFSPTNVIGAGIAECDNDVTDHEKVKQAQDSLIAAFICYGLALIVGLVGIVAIPFATISFAVAGFFAIGAGVLTIAALLIVQSAPVYDGVGSEPNEGVDPADAKFEPFYQNGAVVILALVSAILLFLAGISYFGASFVACRANGGGEVTEAEVVEEKKEVASPKAKAVEVDDAHEDVVPGTNVTI